MTQSQRETLIRADNGAEVAKLQKEIDELRAAVIETCPRLVNESDAGGII